MEKNRIEFSGQIERLQEITTKTGKSMCRFLLAVGTDRFRAVCFGNLASVVMAAGEGATVGITGSGAINSWQTEDGAWRNDFQCTVWAVEIDGEVVSYEKAAPAPPAKTAPSPATPRQDRQPATVRQEHYVQEVPAGIDAPF